MTRGTLSMGVSPRSDPDRASGRPLTLISNSFELVLCARYFLRIHNSF